MNVIVDIPLLVPILYYGKPRTGIARAIESTLVELIKGDDCLISFSVSNNFEQLVQACLALACHPLMSRVPFCPPGNEILKAVTRVATSIYPDPHELSSQRIRRRVVSFLLKRFNLFYRSLDRELLERSDIYHSTFFPLPQQMMGGRLQRFITIYDMIPVLFPIYFEKATTGLFHDILRSIRPDDWVLAISHSTKHDFCEYTGFDPSRVFVTPLAASSLFYPCHDSEKIAEIRSRYRIPEGPYLLSLCTLEPRKNIDHTIRCFIRTVREQRIPDLNLVLVGTKGWDFDRIFAEIATDPGLQRRIIVTGYLPDEDLAPLYSGAMMFVYPSLYEGFGLPPLEAMQCGVPVITSNSSSLPEVVGDAGVIVSPTDSDALCQGFCDLYKNSALREVLAQKSLKQAALFSWEQCARDTVAAYGCAISAASPSNS